MRRALALLLMALALGACGGGGGALSLDPVASAAEKTAKQGSAKVEFRMSGKGMSGNGNGVFNNSQKASGRMTMDMEVKGKSVHMDVVMRDLVIYMRSPLFTSQPSFPEGKEWVRLDLKEAAKSMGLDLDSLQSMSPKSAAAFLRGASGKPKKVGKEKVRGVETTHYRVTCNLEAAADKASGSAAKTLRKLVQVTGQKTIPVEAWIDGHDLLRKETYSQRFARGLPPVKVTTLLYGFGPPVSIDVPPADKVFDITKYAKQ
jgi:hypothetical protein